MIKKPKPFHPAQAQRIENTYKRDTNSFLQRYLGRWSPSDSIDAILEKIRNLAANSDFLTKWSSRLAKRMVTQTRVANAKSWREAAAKSSRGREIYESLKGELHGPLGHRMQELISDNAQLISSIPGKVAESVAREIQEMQLKGMRPDTIAKHLQKRIPQLTKSRVALIARTESSKAATALTRVRSQAIGIDWYQWSSSHDQRVRTSHRNMDGVLVSWSNPPSPEALDGIHSTLGRYHAGDCPNCRCVALPIVSLNLISFPARVYHNGKIERMTLSRFSQISGIQRIS